MIRCCTKNRPSVTPRCERFFCAICSAATRCKFLKAIQILATSITRLQIRAKNMRCETALQIDQCNATLLIPEARDEAPALHCENLVWFLWPCPEIPVRKGPAEWYAMSAHRVEFASDAEHVTAFTVPVLFVLELLFRWALTSCDSDRCFTFWSHCWSYFLVCSLCGG